MQFIKELVEEMASAPNDDATKGSDPNLPPPPQDHGHPPTHEHKDDGPNPTNGPEVVGPPTFQQLLASLKFLEDKVNHHHAEYNEKHKAGGEPGPHDDKTKGEEHKDVPPTDPTKVPPATLFLKNKLSHMYRRPTN